MSGIQLSMRVRSAALQNFERFASEAQVGGDRVLLEAMMRIKERVSTPPPEYAGEPEHFWASEAQRIYVMMNVSFPYARTGELEDSWTVSKTQTGYRLRSNSPIAKYVVGSAVNPSVQYYLHRGRWVPVRVAAEEEIQNLPVEIQEEVSLAARRRGFAP